MLYYQFKDYEGFKELFGLRECGNGQKTRRNKILLAFFKQHSLLKGAIAGDEECREMLQIRTMSELLLVLKRDMRRKALGQTAPRALNRIKPAGWVMYSHQYSFDEREGLCEDKDFRSIRYTLAENGRVYKKKAGRFLKSVLEETEWGRNLPEPVKLWLCEEFTQAWEAHASGAFPDYELHVDDDFSAIYDADRLEGDFHSCMTGEGNYSFYEDSVKAKAAYLTNANGMIVARCVIFEECKCLDGSNRVLRLAERQYSTECDDVLKRCLVDALIRGGHIDGYKRVGADCHSPHSFVLNDGTALSCDMSIKCLAEDGDTCSYMDSFKYLDTELGVAYNDDSYDYDAELDTTGGYVECESMNYDSWHDRRTRNDVVTVYYRGNEYTCDENDLGDFRWVRSEDEYHHEDDVCYCDRCGEYFLMGEGYESELTGEVYCCSRCLERAERSYKEANWYYAEYDDEYFEDEDDVTTFVNCFGREETISRKALEDLIEEGRVVMKEDNVYVAAE